MKVARFFVVAAIFILIGFISARVVISAVEKSDRNECYKWQKQAAEREKGLFYLTSTQKAQCVYYNIPVNAPTRKGVK